MEQTKKAAIKKGLYTVEFEAFWQEYPRRVEKLSAFKAYTKYINMGVTHEAIISGAANYSAWCRNTRREEKYIKHPTTWLNGGCWDDELQNPNFAQHAAGSNRQGIKSRGEIVAELINNISGTESIQ